MPKQTGFLQLEGTYGDVTFIKTKNGFVARRKSSISADRIANDKNFRRTRENNAEFTNTAKGAKLLRLTFNELLQEAKDGRTITRLFSSMMKVVKSDPISKRGERKISKGDISKLETFECNGSALLSVSFTPKYETVIDRASGSLQVNIPAFVPEKSVTMPKGATHFKLVCAGAEIDFDNGTYNVSTSASDIIEWNTATVNALTLSNSVPAGSALPLFIVLGIQFYQKMNGYDYPLQSGAFNALSIVKTSRV